MLRQGVTSNELNACSGRTTSNDVWAVGLNNTIVHYNGSGLGAAHHRTGNTPATASVHGDLVSTDVWVCRWIGLDRALERLEMDSARHSIRPVDFTGVWGSSATNYYACANGGIALSLQRLDVVA